MEEKNYKAMLEAILFTMGEAVEVDRLSAALEISREETVAYVQELEEELEQRGSGLMVLWLEDSVQLATRPEYFDCLVRIARQPKRHVLTDVMLETLSIVAYRQPVTKAEIEKIRGVSSDHALSRLVEYGLVQELGRLDAPGRPILFGTTEEFLRCFGVGRIEDLPVLSPLQVEEFKQEAEAEMNVKLDI